MDVVKKLALIAADGWRGLGLEWLKAAASEAGQEIERLRVALKPFANVADDFDADGRTLRDSDGIYANTAGDFRRARAALRSAEPLRLLP